MKHSFFPLLIGLLCWTGSQAATRTYAYDGSKTQAENGTDLQAAINAASSGDELKVQAGTYIGNFTMKEGVNVSGGWNESFTAQTDYATILDAQANGRVLEQPANFTTLTVWSNLTIQNGKLTAISATPANGLSSGVALGKKGQVKHCLIQNNTYTYSGNCMGGGVGNDAVDANTDVCVDDCWIRNNKGSHGGGVRVRGTVQNSIIENNLTEANAGGGVHLQAGRLVGCVVRGNTGKGTGGVRAYGKCDVINNLIYNNTSTTTIGGLSLESALSNVIGNTIVCNNQLTGTGSQAGVRVTNNLASNSTFFVNNIVWGNMSNGVVESAQVYYISRYDKSAGQRSYNAIMGQKGDDSAETSIQLTADDPGFTDAANGDFSLTSSSILLDRGYSVKATVEMDLAGNTRISGTTVDIGCYEYQYPVLADNYVHPDEDLQEAIDATSAGTTVYVQAGTYYGNFTMKDGVNVSGGWNEDFTAQTDFSTILDANNSGRVVTQSAAFTNNTVWENLTIQHGNVTGAGGGVMLCKNGKLNHCIVRNNTCTTQGGGVYCDDGNAGVIIDNCVISGNSAYQGGGARIRGTIQNSTIEDNTITDSGGGIHLQSATAINCTIRNNTAVSAGGIRAYGGLVENCVIENNTTTTSNTGGVMLQVGAAMYNSIVRDNASGENTGGVRMTYNNDKSCTLANCLIVGNNAAQKIGGLSLEGGPHSVFGNTIVCNNQALTTNPDWCGVRLNVGGSLQFCNNIVWGNKANGVVQASQILVLASYAAQANNFVNNALVWSGKLSDGNDFVVPSTIFLTEDPFKDAANGDYTPTAGSGLIDSGHGGYFHGTTDLAGNTRKQGTIDRGCYEQAAYSREVTEGLFGTICLPYDVPADAIVGAKVYKVISFASDAKAGLLLEQVNAMTAGKPYFFSSEADKVVFAYLATGDAAIAGSENGLHGTLAEEAISGADYYVLQNNLLCPATAGEISLSANRAYLMFSEVPDYEEAAPSPIRRVIAIQQTENTATGTDQMVIDKSVNGKFIHDGQLLIIRDGKTYNVLGL